MDQLTRELSAALIYRHRDQKGRSGAVFRLSASFIGFAGHFPGKPILPAVAQIQMACLVAAPNPQAARPAQVLNAKFTSPVGPDQPVTVRCEPDPKGKGRIKATLDVEGRVVASVSLVLQD